MGLVLNITNAYIDGTMNTRALPEWAIVIKRFRGLQGLTQQEFADKYNVTQVTVSYWERGRSRPPAEILMLAMKVTV